MERVVQLLVCIIMLQRCLAQNLNPNEKAPNFTLPTLKGRIVYKGLGHKDTNIHPPIIFHEFTNHSGFLESLWTKESSLLELIDNSPDNTQYVFLSSSNDAMATAEWMKKQFENALEKYFSLAKNLSKTVGKEAMFSESRTEEPGQRRSFDSKSFERIIQYRKIHASFPLPRRRINRRSVNNTDLPKIRKPGILKHANIPKSIHKWNWKTYEKYNDVKSHIKIPKEHLRFDQRSYLRKRSIIQRLRSEVSEDADEEDSDKENTVLQDRVIGIMRDGKWKFVSNWLDRLHFVTIPLYEVGNWIPLVMSRWYCSGHGCGLDQIAVENENEGDVYFVSKRLDGRYDWLPSPYTKSKHPRFQVVHVGDGCSLDESTNITSKLVLASRGNCSFFKKLQNAQQKSAVGLLVYSSADEPLVDMTCNGPECEEEIKTPGSMIPYESGKKILKLLELPQDVYVKFQHTPSRNFFLAIDEQGKLQEVGWLLYPSMIFLSYQAKWLNYKTDLLRNISSMNADVVTVFNASIMHGEKGVVKTIQVPSLQDLQRYKHVYLDMALGCPGSTDYTCPHWDHTVQLFLCCNKSSLCGKEIGRWITPFRRRIGRWLTNIRPLIPLFTSTKCTFTMKTVPWAMPWKPALSLRLADKQVNEASKAPFKIISLFRGGKFDSTYNTKNKRALNFTVPDNTTQIKLFATITGHGSDNNNCAEFCVTSHHFTINHVHKNTRIFDSAGTATGCADKVSEGSEPNEHGTWLYGRDGWCDGQNVSPWVEDVTSQIDMKKTNHIKYYGYFNGTDPNPTSNAGEIIMYSYLVFYKVV